MNWVGDSALPVRTTQIRLKLACNLSVAGCYSWGRSRCSVRRARGRAEPKGCLFPFSSYSDGSSWSQKQRISFHFAVSHRLIAFWFRSFLFTWWFVLLWRSPTYHRASRRFPSLLSAGQTSQILDTDTKSPPVVKKENVLNLTCKTHIFW